MQIHQIGGLKTKTKKKRIGRGGKRGGYSGRGIKGQKSRAGTSKKEPITKKLIKRYPKLRGHKFKFKRTKYPLAIVNISDLSDKFNQDELINAQVLLEKGIIKKIKGKIPQVKILGKGDLTKRLNIENCLMSKSVKEKLEKLNQKKESDPLSKA